MEIIKPSSSKALDIVSSLKTLTRSFGSHIYIVIEVFVDCNCVNCSGICTLLKKYFKTYYKHEITLIFINAETSRDAVQFILFLTSRSSSARPARRSVTATDDVTTTDVGRCR